MNAALRDKLAKRDCGLLWTGLKCVDCGAELEPSVSTVPRQRCDACKIRRRKVLYENRRSELKARGICTRCGRRQTENGNSMCAVCISASNASEYRKKDAFKEKNRARSKATYERLRAAGICVRCRAAAESGSVLCAACKASDRELRAQRRADGVCVRCGKARAEAGITMCEECAGKERYLQKRRRWGG